MNELAQIDRLLADLKLHSERRGLSYGEVVLLDDFISAFESARARAAEDHETGLPGTRALPRSVSTAIRKGKTT